MKRRAQKIKQYSPFEDRRATRRKRLLRGAALVAGLAVLFGVGWWLAATGVDWFGREADLPEVIIPEAVSIPDASAPEVEDASVADIDGDDLEPLPLATGGSWAVLEPAGLGAEELVAEVQRLADSSVSHVLVTLKDSTGTLYFDSREAAAAGSIDATGFDAARVAEAISDAGMVPAAGICAYEDSLAPYNDRSMAVQLASGSNYLWLNNSPANGGKPWLNPYSDKAEAYIAGIIDEALALGYREVVVEGLQFPNGYGLEQANLAATGTVIGEAAQLQATAQSWQQRVAAAGGQCWFSYPADALLGESAQTTGESPFGFGINYVVAVADSAEQADALVLLAGENGVQMLAVRGVDGYAGEGDNVGVAVFLN